MKPSNLALAALVLVSALMLSGCGAGATPTAEAPAPTLPPEPTAVPTEAPPEPVVLRVGTTLEPDTFHPFLTKVAWRHLELMYEAFVWYGPECEYTPRLAESLEVSEDGLTNTIHLRPGVTYSDGQVFDANVLKQSWDWLTSLEVGSWFPTATMLESYEAVDDLTFRFTTTAPSAAWPTYDAVWMWPFAPHIWGSLDDETLWTFDNNTNPIGTGPYTLTEWVLGDHLIFDARPDYYLGKPPVDRIVIQIYANWDAVVNAAIGGEIDITDSYVPGQYYDVLKGDPNLTLLELPPTRYYLLAFNVKEGGKKHPAIDDPKVREAIDYAIDRQQLVDVALMGHGITCSNQKGCGQIFEWAHDPSITVTPFDPGKSNAILDEAGYLDKDGDGVREMPDGEPLEFRLYFPADLVTAISMADYIKEWLSEAGIAVSVEAMERGTLETVSADEHDFDMMIRFDTTDPDPTSADFWLSCWSSEGGAGNVSGYCNPEYDALIYKQLTALGKEERLVSIFEMQRILASDRPVITLVGENATQAYRNDRFVFPEDTCSFYAMGWGWPAILEVEPVK